MEYQIVNLTGHEVHELRSDIVYPSNGKLRIKTRTKLVAFMNGATVETTEAYVDSLPPRKEGTFYIVSQLALNAIPADRTDILAPKQVYRHKDGPLKNTVKGCIGFRTKE